VSSVRRHDWRPTHDRRCTCGSNAVLRSQTLQRRRVPTALLPFCPSTWTQRARASAAMVSSGHEHTHPHTHRHAHAQAQSTGKCQVAALQPTRFFLCYIALMQRQLTVDNRVQGPGSEASIFSVTSSNCLARFTLDFPILTQLSSSAVETM
jgi:hypothetical protein